MLESKKTSTLAFMLDDRLSREKTHLLMRIVNALRHVYKIDVLTGGTSEEELIKKLQEKHADLVIVPWYRYLAWSRVEALNGLTRTSGPTFAGYFADQLLPYEIGEQADHLRTILLDFANLGRTEALTLVDSLIVDKQRTGLRPLLEKSSTIYCENWFAAQGLGNRIDSILSLSDIANTDWIKRASAVRICLGALWSLVYEEGPGKGEFAKAAGNRSPRAYFQVGVDRSCLALRLCYSMTGWTPKDALSTFWPNVKRPTAPAQLLLKYADFVRVHTIADTPDIEVVIGFFPSAAAETNPNEIRTLWVEPVANQLLTELPYETPGSPDRQYLKALPTGSHQPGTGSTNGTSAAPTAAAGSTNSSLIANLTEQLKTKDKHLFNAAVNIRDLRRAVRERDEMIRELRAGGIGTAPQMPPPDAEALIEAFQERYMEAKFQIRQLEVQIMQAEQKGATPKELELVRRKIETLAVREQQWIKALATLLDTVRQNKPKKDGTGG